MQYRSHTAPQIPMSRGKYVLWGQHVPVYVTLHMKRHSIHSLHDLHVIEGDLKQRELSWSNPVGRLIE